MNRNHIGGGKSGKDNELHSSPFFKFTLTSTIKLEIEIEL